MATPAVQKEIADAILKLKSLHLYEVEYALRILINYAIEPTSQVAIRNLKGLEAIIPLLQHDNQIITMLAAWSLSNLALNDANRVAILKGGTVKVMVPVLSSSSNGDVLTKFLWLLTNLANNEANRKFLSVCGIPKLLANLLKFPNDNVLIELTKPLRNMLIELESQKVFAQAGGILNLIALLTSTNQTLLHDLMEVVLTLCVGTDIMRKLVVAAGILPPIVFLLSSGNDRVILQALKVLIALSLTEENEMKILNAGAILPIVDLFCSKKAEIQNDAALLLSNLSCNVSIRESLRQSGVVNPLVEAVNSTSLKIQEQASRLITNMSMDDYNRMELFDAGAIPALEKLLQSKEAAIREVAGFAINNLRVPVPESVRNPVPITNEPSESLVSSAVKPVTEPKAVGKPTAAQNSSSTPAVTPSTQQKSTKPDAAQPGSVPVHFTYSAAREPTPQLMRRDKICRELYDTEKSYVQGLGICVKYYLSPLMEAAVKSDPIIPTDHIKVLFSIIEIIYKLNDEFLLELQYRMSTWDPFTTCVGDITEKFTEKLKVYTRYINNYDKTMNVYTLCIKNYSRFADFIYSTRELPKVKGLDLLSYLIMPVQRIPRYILLLTDMLKQTPKDHPDYPYVERAMQKTKAIADYLNEAKRHAESVDRVQVIYDSCLNQELVADLVSTGRYFVREAIMVVKKSGQGSKYGYFYLLNDTLLHTVLKKGGNYQVKHRVAIQEITVSDEADTNVLKNSFKITWPKGALVISANSAEEKKAWMTDLTDLKNQKFSHFTKQ